MTDFVQKLNGGPYLMPRSGVVKSAVIILHGYGADGANLIGLGQGWSMKMPDTVFIAPNAFSHCEAGIGYQWFSLSSTNVEFLHAQIETIETQWQALIDSVKAEFGLEDTQICLCGFSQGSMLALHQGVYGTHKFRGIIGYSGGFAPNPSREVIHHPQTLIMHGLDDQVVPSQFSETGHAALEAFGCASELILYPDTQHEINEDGYEAGGAFLKDLLY